MNHGPMLHIIKPSKKKITSVKKFLQRHPEINYKWVRAESHPTHLETLLEWGYSQGFRTFVIWGGDGSFSRAIQYCWKNQLLDDVTFSVVPVGTCNDFCRHLYSIKWPAIIKGVMASTAQQILCDVGCVDSSLGRRIFINNAGFGRDEKAAQKKGKSNPIKDVLNLTPRSLSLQWNSQEGHEFATVSALMMIVFNAPYFNGGLHFSTDMSTNDGLLNGVVIPDMSRWTLLSLLAKGKCGVPMTHRLIQMKKVESIVVESNHSIMIQVDGEVAFDQPVNKVRFALLPNKIKFLQGQA